MWNLVSGNRLIDRRAKQEAHRRHIVALNTMKSSINNAPPSQYSFLYSRPKAQQLKFCKTYFIQKDRQIYRTTIQSSLIE